MLKKFNVHLDNNELELSNKWTDIIRVGDWRESYKEFQITPQDLNLMVSNFNDNVLGLDKGEVQFNYSHHSFGEAAGWIEALQIEDGVLQARVRWTKTAQERIKNEHFKYVSAEIDFNYRDEETGKRYGLTLTGAALTNIPFVRGMKAVALSNNQEGQHIFLSTNKANHMDFFKKLLSTLQEQDIVTLGEVSMLKAAFVELSEEEQAEVQPEVDAVEEAATEAAEAAEAEAAEKEEELQNLRKQAELANDSSQVSQQLADAQKQLSNQQKELDQMKLAARTNAINLSVESLAEQGKIAPAQKEGLVKLLLSESPARAEEWVKHLESGPAIIQFGEIGNEMKEEKKELADIDNTEIQALAAKLQEEQNLSINEAISKAMDQLSQ